MRMEAPGGKIGHAEIEIGDSMVMLSDSFPQSTTTSPSALGGTTAGVVLYVEDGGRRRCHRHHGGRRPVLGRSLRHAHDPFGHAWSIATHVEDVPPDEIAERAKEAMAEMSSS
jgi:PhnB protein